MHSRIFEISRAPINRKERIKAYDLPEWFCGEIADYVDDIHAEYREENLDWFASRFGETCKRVGDKLTFSERAKEAYFKSRYQAFVAAARAAAECTLEEFCGDNKMSSFTMTIYRLKESYEDRFGFYIYDHDVEELMTLDTWIRAADLAKSYYLGSSIDYHF